MTVKEIHEREADGITVTLFAHFGDTECEYCSVHVLDTRTGTEFTLSEIPNGEALDAFYHPFAIGERLLTTGVAA
jgi:hypothetical protein